MPATKTHTVESLIRRYAKDVVFVATKGGTPTTTLEGFLSHMCVAGKCLRGAGLDEDNVTGIAAAYLADAAATDGVEREVLLTYATAYLVQVGEMAGEYRGMC